MPVEGDVLLGEIRKLERVLRRQFVGALPQRILDTSLTAAARVVVKQAKTPGFAFNDRTGRLRRTIKTRRLRGRRGSFRGGGSGTAHVSVGVSMGDEGARQGVLIELGTENMKARAPLRRAVHETVEEQANAMWRRGNSELSKYIKEINSGNLRPATRRALAG